MKQTAKNLTVKPGSQFMLSCTHPFFLFDLTNESSTLYETNFPIREILHLYRNGYFELYCLTRDLYLRMRVRQA